MHLAPSSAAQISINDSIMHPPACDWLWACGYFLETYRCGLMPQAFEITQGPQCRSTGPEKGPGAGPGGLAPSGTPAIGSRLGRIGCCMHLGFGRRVRLPHPNNPETRRSACGCRCGWLAVRFLEPPLLFLQPGSLMRALICVLLPAPIKTRRITRRRQQCGLHCPYNPV